MTTTEDRTAWLTERRKGIGASEVAAIMRLSPWATPYSVWADKVGLTPLDQPGTDAMRWGNYVEGAIIDWFEDETGLGVGNRQMSMHAEGREWARVTLDGRVFESRDWDIPSGDPIAVFEAKSTSEGEWDHVPVHYQCQAQWAMWVTGLRNTTFAVLHMPFGRPTLRTYHLAYNPDDVALIVDTCERFWTEHVLTGIPPEVDGHPATTAALGHIDPADDTDPIDLTGEAVGWLHVLRDLKGDARKLDARISEAENHVKAAMGEHTEAVHDGAVVATWRPQTRTRLDTTALKAAMPDVAEQFTTTTTTRTLLVKHPKGDK